MTTKYNLLSDERITAHKRVFVRWLNTKLSKVSPTVQVQDLIEDLKNGCILLALLEVLGLNQEQEHGKTGATPLQNVAQALLQFEQNKVEVFGITSADIVEGKDAVVLGLVWNIIWRFQIQGADRIEASNVRLDKTLLRWCRTRLRGYVGKVEVNDFSKSWRDGLAFNALLHSFRPSLFHFDTITACDVHTRLVHAFNIATMEFSVPCYLEPNDVDRDDPDEMLIMLYLSCLYQNTRKERGLSSTAAEANGHVTVTSDHVDRMREERLLHVSGFPNVIHIEKAKSLKLTPIVSSKTTKEHETEQVPEARLVSESEPMVMYSSSPVESKPFNFTSTPLSKKAADSAGQNFSASSGEAPTTKPSPPDRTDGVDKERQTGTDEKPESPSGSSSSSSSPFVSAFSSAEEDTLLSFSGKYEKRKSSSPERYTTSLTIHSNGRAYPHGRVDFVEYLDHKLQDVDRCLSAKEAKIMDTDLDSMDLKTAKQSLDYHQELMDQLDALEPTIDSVLGEGGDLVRDGRFDEQLGIYFEERMQKLEERLKSLQANVDKEQQRLFDIYSILMSQHVERMNDWLLRAEATVALGDDVDLTYEDVKAQVQHHEKFMTDLADHSMVNVIFEMDMEVTVLDENTRDWVKALSERWAAVWTWAEEWKHTLTQVLNDWERLRREQKILLDWMSSKEETLDIMGQTDITDENQVLVHQNLLKTVEREMLNQERRLESLHESAEQLIGDAGYHNFTAKSIRDQVKDFDECWDDISKKVQRRQKALNGTKDRLKQIGGNLKEVREWMRGTETFLNFINNHGDISEDKAVATIQQMCKERDHNQSKVKQIDELVRELAQEVDSASQDALRRVLTPFHKRWKVVNESLDTFRTVDFPYLRGDECFLVNFLRRNLSITKLGTQVRKVSRLTN